MTSLNTISLNKTKTLGPSLVCLATLIAFGPTVHPGYVTLDSAWLTTGNALLQRGEFEVVSKIWTDFSVGTRLTLGAEYLPVRDTSVWLDFLVFGERWAGHHLVNLLLYILAALLFHRFAVNTWRDFKGPEKAEEWGLWCALLFAAHPVHVESVAWLASRKDMLSLVFGMSALLLWRGRTHHRWSTPLSLLATLLAIWSKNVALTLPFVFLAIDLIERPTRLRSKAFWRTWAPFGALAIGCALLSRQVGQSMGMFAPKDHDLLHTIALQGAAFWHYALSLAWPTKLAIVYDLSADDALIGFAMVAAVAWLLWRHRKTSPLATVGALWFLLTLAPTSPFVHLQNMVADRYMMLPSAGFALATLAVTAQLVTKHPRLITPTRAVLTVATIGLLTLSYLRVHDWRSSETLYSAGVQTHPGEPEHYIGLAGALLTQNQPDKATEVIENGLQRVGENPKLLQTLGWIQTQQKRFDEAEQTLKKALSLDPHLRKAMNNLTMLKVQAGELETAHGIASQLVQTHPLYARGWTTLGAVKLQQRDLDGAERTLKRALSLNPYAYTAHCNLGGTYWLQQRPELAVSAWETCLAGDPENTQALGGLHAAKRRLLETQ